MRSGWLQLRAEVEIHLLSADTYGTLADVAAQLHVPARRLGPGDQAAQKAAAVEALGAAQVAAIGNGANDAAMLRQAALGIAVLGPEGLATACLTAADVLVPDITAALDLLWQPRRLVATLPRLTSTYRLTWQVFDSVFARRRKKQPMAYMTEKRLQEYTDQINSAPDSGGEWQAMATVLCLDDWEVRQRLSVLEAALQEILAALSR